MGKRKRSKDEKDEIVENLLKKVKKLVKKRRRLSSTSSEDLRSEDLTVVNRASDLEIQEEIQNNEPLLEEEPLVDEAEDENPELDPDILSLLGTDPTKQRTVGDNLHKDLATRWKHILLNGLPKDDKAELLKQYLPAENCLFMKAPVLNMEIKSALSEINLKKDSFSEQKQNQMSSCISAIGIAMNLALSQTENIPQEIIKTLSDAARLLCDTHYRESISRRYTIINSLGKQKRDVIKNTKIDEFLFGSNLGDHLKSSKAISVSAAELRFNPNNNRFNQVPRAQPNMTTVRLPRALNVRGAPRAPVAEPRVYPAQSRRPTLPPPAPRDGRRAAMTSRQRTNNYPQQARRR